MNLEISHDFDTSENHAVGYNRRCQLLYFYYRHVMGFTRSKSKKLLRKFEPGYSCDYGYNECYGSDRYQAIPPITWEEEYAQFVKAEDEYIKNQEETELSSGDFLHMHYNYGYTRLFGYNPVNAILDKNDLWDYHSSTMYNGHFQSEFVLNLKIRRSSNRFTRINNGRFKRISSKFGGYSWRDKYAKRCRRYDDTTSNFLACRGTQNQSPRDKVTKEQAYLDTVDSRVDAETPCEQEVMTFTLTIPKKNGNGFSTCQGVYVKGRSFVMYD